MGVINMNFEAILSIFFNRNKIKPDCTFHPQSVKFTGFQSELIEIRNAKINDIEIIGDLLHAEGLSWNDKKIQENLMNLFVMTLSGNIISVMHAFIIFDKFSCEWIAVHPMYPEKPVKAAIYSAVSSIALRQVNELLDINNVKSLLQSILQSNIRSYLKKDCSQT
jgi:hypothetical protein